MHPFQNSVFLARLLFGLQNPGTKQVDRMNRIEKIQANLILMQSHLLHSSNRILQFPNPMSNPPLHFLSDLLIRSLEHSFVCFLDFCQFFACSGAVFFGVDGVVFGFFGGDFEL